MRSLIRKLRWLTERAGKETELREELGFHLEEEAAERQERGQSREDAHRAARRDLGHFTLVIEDTRAAWSWTFWDQLLQDTRYAVRVMAASKTFSSLAILSLALGIGANTAIFSFMDSILMRSLPVTDPQSLVLLSWHTPKRETHGTNRHDNSFTDPNGGFVGGFFAYPAFELLRKGDRVFSSVFGYQGAGNLTLTLHEQSDVVQTEYVSGNYFSGLGVSPSAGRLISPDDDRAGAPAVATISLALSQRRFGGPEQAAGQSILLNNLPFTVIGVTPPGFFGADPKSLPDVYVPMHANLLLEAGDRFAPPARLYIDPYYDWVVIMARLRPGVSAAQAQAALAPAFYEWGRSIGVKRAPEDVPTLVVRDGAGGLDGLRRQYSRPLYLLLTLVGLILAIACANIANLLLARASARKREIALRLSMGAGRARVIRQLLTESLVLALLGGVLGVGFALWGMQSLTLLLANGRENFTLHAELNWRLLAVAAGLAVVTGVVFGLAPAIQSTRADLLAALKSSTTGARGQGLRGIGLSRLLLVAQFAISLVILVAAGLFLRTLSNLQAIQVGFNAESVLTFRLDARQAGHSDPGIVPFYNDLRRQFLAIPGVLRASLSDKLLIGAGTGASQVVAVGSEPKGSSVLSVGADFFATMQVPILMGRAVEERDLPGSPIVAVVNQELAGSVFGTRSPLGAHLTMPRICATCDIEIVGVAANLRYGDLKKAARPTLYLSYAQGVWGPVAGMTFELRTTGNPLGYVRAVRELVHRADERLPLSNVRTQEAWIDQMIGQEITFARLCTAFALLALVIACVGLYGTLSYNVSRRTGEIGIRMALGARRSRVIWMVLREVFILVAAGLAISLPIIFASTKLVEAFLFEMQRNDPTAVGLSVLTIVTAAVLAGYVPARSASRIDPMVALRHD